LVYAHQSVRTQSLFLLAELYIFLIFLRKKCLTRFIFYLYRNSWPDFYCTMLYHFTTWVRTYFW